MSNIKELEHIARDTLSKYDLNDWEFKWTRAKTQMGICNYTQKFIALSLPLAEVNTRETNIDTILHEVAHILAGKEAQHGRAWQQACLRIGADPSRLAYGCNKIEGKYRYKCGTCGYTTTFHKKIKVARACSTCCDKYNHGSYSTEYKLKLEY